MNPTQEQIIELCRFQKHVIKNLSKNLIMYLLKKCSKQYRKTGKVGAFLTNSRAQKFFCVKPFQLFQVRQSFNHRNYKGLPMF